MLGWSVFYSKSVCLVGHHFMWHCVRVELFVFVGDFDWSLLPFVLAMRWISTDFDWSALHFGIVLRLEWCVFLRDEIFSLMQHFGVDISFICNASAKG